MNCLAIEFLAQLAPREYGTAERQAWMDGLLCATVLFDTEAEREITADWWEYPETFVKAFLAGRARGAEFNQPTPGVDYERTSEQRLADAETHPFRHADLPDIDLPF